MARCGALPPGSGADRGCPPFLGRSLGILGCRLRPTRTGNKSGAGQGLGQSWYRCPGCPQLQHRRRWSRTGAVADRRVPGVGARKAGGPAYGWTRVRAAVGVGGCCFLHGGCSFLGSGQAGRRTVGPRQEPNIAPSAQCGTAGGSTRRAGLAPPSSPHIWRAGRSGSLAPGPGERCLWRRLPGPSAASSSASP